ncbi:hypothetical protein [Aliiroseovarius lamellibrachiae]|uniref:hypothetical protein n=1 Tax=Aliiroseovarius lamellibrachiae TaxID=1924933 RepID=UPI001BE00D7D|nr:hypothetical protein [Aliiroseovarius lamellibrachiae]MBT2132247.1 hypothetical protein [Aliiroseovarius lamellibrachiae]
MMKRTFFGGVIAATSLMMSMSSAWAITSCWQASDPPGCWLQCTFGGPCPLESVAGEGAAIEVELPNPETGASHEFARTLKDIGKIDVDGFKKSRDAYRKIGAQTCKPQELVEVMTKAVGQGKGHMAAAGAVAKNCFK